MQNFFTPEEVAEMLKVDPEVILGLIQDRQLRAIRLGHVLRIAENALEECLQALTLASQIGPIGNASKVFPDGGWCPTFAGQSRFRVNGSVKEGAKIWFGRRRTPLTLPAEFFTALLDRFGGEEVAVGTKFDGANPGTLADWVQKNLPTKMNPVSYVAGLLIAEGYAERARPGRIRFRSLRPAPASIPPGGE